MAKNRYSPLQSAIKKPLSMIFGKVIGVFLSVVVLVFFLSPGILFDLPATAVPGRDPDAAPFGISKAPGFSRDNVLPSNPVSVLVHAIVIGLLLAGPSWAMFK